MIDSRTRGRGAVMVVTRMPQTLNTSRLPRSSCSSLRLLATSPRASTTTDISGPPDIRWARNRLHAELTAAAAAHGRPLGTFGTYQVIRREDDTVIGDAGFMDRPTTPARSTSAAGSPRARSSGATRPRR